MAAAAESTSRVALITVGPPATNVTLVAFRTASRLAGIVSESATVPVKPLIENTLIWVSPTRGPSGVPSGSWNEVTRGPMLVWEEVILKSAVGGDTLTATLVVLDNVGAVPVVPVMVRVKLAGDGTAVQLTVRVVPETVAVHPVGAALVENVTVPEKPLMAVNDSVEVLEVPVVTLSEFGLAATVKSTTWNVTVLELWDCEGEPPTPVTNAV